MEIACNECGCCVDCHDDDELCDACCCVMGSCTADKHCNECQRCIDCASDFCSNQVCQHCYEPVHVEEECLVCELCMQCRKRKKTTCCYQSENGVLRCRLCKQFDSELCKICHRCWNCDDRRNLSESLCKAHYAELTHQRMREFKETLRNPRMQDPNILRKISTYLI